MRILALETSSKHSSVALLDATRTLLATSSPDFAHNAKLATSGSSSLLVPMIDASLKKIGWKPADIELVAMPIGPGSFTGLRVGVVTVKALAYVNNPSVVGVNTLEVIAAQTLKYCTDAGVKNPRKVCVAINAQRQQLFCENFESETVWSVQSLSKTTIEDRGDWLDRLDQESLVTGTGCKLLRDELGQRQAKQGFQIADESVWAASAESVGRVGFAHYQNGRRDDPWKIEPVYYRPSAAEERLQK